MLRPGDVMLLRSGQIENHQGISMHYSSMRSCDTHNQESVLSAFSRESKGDCFISSSQKSADTSETSNKSKRAHYLLVGKGEGEMVGRRGRRREVPPSKGQEAWDILLTTLSQTSSYFIYEGPRIQY